MFYKLSSSLLLLLSALGSMAQPPASPSDELRAVVIVARHGVRTPIESETRSGIFNAKPWPAWPSAPGLLTPHGIEALQRMGEFYHHRYASLLNGCGSVTVESTNVPRTIASAKAVLSVVVPACTLKITPDLSADPPTIDKAKLADAINGRMANQPEWFTHVFAQPLEEMHDVLAHCADCKSIPDFRTRMLDSGAPSSMMQSGATPAKRVVVPRDARKENAVVLGADFAENFLLQYAEGMPMNQVGWGRVSRAKLDQLMEMNTRYHDFILRTPYYAQQAAGPLALKISQYLEDAAHGTAHPRFIYLSAHDANLTWLGGLLRIDWIVSDETLNATPPGSALVFELHHNTQTNADTVQTFFIAQKLDQIRNLTHLTESEQPSVAPVFIPGCSGKGPGYACTVEDFAHAASVASQP